MTDRKSFATQKEIWWELDKLAISLASQGRLEDAEAVEGCMEVLERPNHDECQRFFAEGY